MTDRDIMTGTDPDGSHGGTRIRTFDDPGLRGVRVLGRQPRQALRPDGSSARPWIDLTYSCSGIEFDFTGQSVWLRTDAGWTDMEPWLVIELDGAQIQRLPIPRGKAEIEVFAHMNPGAHRAWHVRILRESQPMGEPGEYLRFTGLRSLGGSFLSLPRRHRLFEFVEDSITSGEGAVGAEHDNDWASVFFGGSQAYPRLVADALDADFRVVSQSGWGISSSWDDVRSHRIPRIYTQVCGALGGAEAVSSGMREPYDFSAFPADAVVINLGTNDNAAFTSPAATDPVTGERYDARLRQDGSYDPDSLALIVREAKEFLALVRKKNPQALLLWALGAWPSPMTDAMRTMVDDYRRSAHDGRVRFLTLPAMTEGTTGSHEHPSSLWHRQAATAIIDLLRPALG